MQQTQSNCTKQHMELPLGFQIVRCKHGRIGQQDFAVVESAASDNIQKGAFAYAALNNDGWFSLVCMWDYPSTRQDFKDSLFFGFTSQLLTGRVPVPYVMYLRQDEILGVKHTPVSMEVMMFHTYNKGELLPEDQYVLIGKCCKYPEQN